MSVLAAEKIVPVSESSEGALLGRIVDVNQLSARLDRSYHELESRIGQLQVQLAQSDQQRLQEYDAKEKLAERLDTILGVMPVAVIVLDARGVVAQANAIAEELLGCQLGGLRWIEVIRRCFAPTPADGHEVLLLNGRLISLATQSLKNEPGQIIVLTDQTETRRLQDNLNHHRKLSEMGRMTASLAHQIRTPLSSAILFADHMSNPNLPDDKKCQYAERIRTQLNQLEQQVRDMLIFSKGGVVLDQLVSVEQVQQRFGQQLLDLCTLYKAEYELESDGCSGNVRCNLELLTSTFNNLVDNALQACKSQKNAPRLKLSFQKSKDSVLVIRLTDNGPGIPAGCEQKILEPFFTTKSTGTGLGLAVVNTIVESHGGSFSIQNIKPSGAEAAITLPLFQHH